MRKLLFIAVSLLALQFGCGGGPNNGAKPKPNDGMSSFSIAVQSTPPGAEILLDGKSTGFRSSLIGMEPVPLPLPLTEGKPQLLSLRVEGYHDWNQWVEKTEGVVIVSARLQPKSTSNGQILISSEPEGAKIVLNGVDTGKITPATISVASSSHAIKVEKDGFLSGYETVFVPPGEQVEVHIPLQPSNTGVISGVVYDRFGATPTNVLLKLQTSQGQTVATTRSSSFGLFRFLPIPPGTYTVAAEIEVEGEREVGQLENVLVQAGERTFISLVVFPANLMGSVEGIVKDGKGKLIPNAQVAILYYAAGLDFVLTSRRVLTNQQGRFRLDNVPAATQVLVVRKQGYQATQTQVSVRQGEVSEVEIVLQPLGNQPSLQPPTRVFALSYTVPTEFLSTEGRSASKFTSEKSGSELCRQFLARLLKRHKNPAAAILEQLTKSNQTMKRFFPIGFMGSVGIGWEPPLTIPSQGLLGYRVYQAIPNSAGWKLRFVIDEPEQTTAEDVAFDFTPGRTYRYAVTAITLDGNETKRSEPADAVLLPPIRLIEPTENALVAQSQLKFQWSPVNGLVPYYFVQLYSSLEAILLAEPVWSTDAISGTTQAVYDGHPLLKGKTYWWLVIGSDHRDWRQANAFTVSQARQVVIVGD
ncbi:MAG: PEGA domain-containing protein [Candidatus Fervidibacter sp.]|uniref:PEGA domain-containing protein n=1 Tax=Candidatus Fervidibacter sp. TaxID=3100871 RepID=UPI00404B9437